MNQYRPNSLPTIYRRMRDSVVSFVKGGEIQKAPTTDIGNPGGDIQNGYSYLDTNQEWQGQARRDLVRQMILDEKINQVLVSYKNPIHSACFYVKPAEDEKGVSSPEDEANAEAVEENLFDEMEGGFREFLRNATSCLEWGHAVFEEVYYYDGYWKIKKLAFRDQHTIEKWSMEDGNPGVMQRIQYPDTNEENVYNIPMKKLLIFTMNRVGKNPEGVSLLRPIYRQWKIKDLTWKYQVRILEKFSGGILQVWTPKNASAEAITEIEEIIGDISASKRAGIVHPGTKEDGWLAEFMDLKIGDTKIMETLEKLDASISESMLNSFLDSAKTSSSGSFARTDSLKEFFYMALNGWLELFVSTFNEVTMKRLAYYNGWKKAPKLCFHPIRSEVEVDKFANAIKTAVDSGAVIVTDEDENVVRNRLGLPEQVIDENAPPRSDRLPKKEVAPTPAPESNSPAPKDKGTAPDKEKKSKMQKHDCDHDHPNDEEVADLRAFQKKLIEAQHATHFSIGDLRQLVANRKDFTPSDGRELTPYEKKANLGGLSEYIDAATALLEAQVSKITDEQKDYILEVVKKAIDQDDLSILTDAKIPGELELISLLTEMSKESFEAGKITAAQEIGSEVPKTGRAVLGTIRADQVAVVTGMIEGMKANAISSTTQIIKRKGNDITNVTSAEVVTNVRAGLETYITRQKALYNTGSVISSINAGRTATFDDNATTVIYAQYSAILDSRTTERCRQLDGRIVKYGSGEYLDYSPPGHFYCRSIWVGINKDDPGVDKINLKHIPASIEPTGPLGSYRDKQTL